MTGDARFEDAQDKPLRLVAADGDDLSVMSTLLQDAILLATEIRWEPSKHRFSMLLKRFRWEDHAAAHRAQRAYERVQSVLSFGDVRAVASQGIDRKDPETVLSLLAISFAPTDAPAGQIELTFAGDGAVRLDVDCIDANLRDVTRPYIAPSGHAPQHDP